MIQLVLFGIVGAGFLVLLYLFAVRTHARPEGSAEALVEARQALNSLQTSLLPPELIGRVFAQEDRSFVLSACSKDVQAAFLAERKRIALLWIAQLRKQILSLREFHSGQSKRYAKLDLRSELLLALNFVALLAVCRFLQMAFYLRGAYAAPRLVRGAVAVAGDVCEVSERCLAILGPVPNMLRGTGTSAGDRAAI